MRRVYFMKPIGMDGPVKVGCSITPEDRLKSLDIWSPFPLELIASVPGDYGQERAVHWHLRDERRHGEWFAWSERLEALLDHVRRLGVLPPLEASPYGKTKMGRGRNPSRNPQWRRAKARLTERVGRAEDWAFGSRHDATRPAHIVELIRTYQGPFVPPPDANTVAALEEYIASLRAMPKCTKTWQERWAARQAAAEARKAAA